MSNVLSFRDPEAIEAEAWQWLIRIDGDSPLSEDEEVALREWSAQSPAHLGKLREISRFWNKANALTQLEVPLHPRRSWFPWKDGAGSNRTLFLGVSTAGILLALGLTLWRMNVPVDRNGTYSTTIGQQRALALPDGSTVRINTDSRLVVDYTDHARTLRLLRGEAYFSVAPNAQKPFEVYAGQGVVRAVGTAFAVHLRDTSLDVTVTNGRVDVISGGADRIEPAHAAGAGPSGAGVAPPAPRPAKHVSLQAGQTAVFSAKRGDEPALETKMLSAPELEQRLAWHEGYWVFTGQPLDAVVNELNRYSPITLQIADPSLSKLAVGGRFKVGDLDAFYDALQNNFGIQSVRIDDRHIALRPADTRP